MKDQKNVPTRVVGLKYMLSSGQEAWLKDRGCEITENEDGVTKRILFPDTGKLIRSTPEPGRLGAFRFADGIYLLWQRDIDYCEMSFAGPGPWGDEELLLEAMGDEEPVDPQTKTEHLTGWARELLIYRLCSIQEALVHVRDELQDCPQEAN